MAIALQVMLLLPPHCRRSLRQQDVARSLLLQRWWTILAPRLQKLPKLGLRCRLPSARDLSMQAATLWSRKVARMIQLFRPGVEELDCIAHGVVSRRILSPA